MLNFARLVFQFILKLVFGLSAAIVAVALLWIALIVVTLSFLKSFVTGRKSTPAMTFTRFHQFSRRSTWPDKRPFPAKRKAGLDQIVDVEAHEVTDTQREP